MEKEVLRDQIIDIIDRIESENKLQAIHSLLSAFENKQLVEVEEADEKAFFEKEDFNDFIREWTKNM